MHTNSGVGNKAAQLITDGPGGVGGIGLDKAAAIYYLAEQTLTSGADYRDLYNVLIGSCTAWWARRPRCSSAPSSDGAITTDDCDWVTTQLTAVKMNVYPADDAPLPPTPGYCGTGYTVTDQLSDRFDTALADRWVSSGAWIRNADYMKSATSGLLPGSSTTRTRRRGREPAGPATQSRPRG